MCAQNAFVILKGFGSRQEWCLLSIENLIGPRSGMVVITSWHVIHNKDLISSDDLLLEDIVNKRFRKSTVFIRCGAKLLLRLRGGLVPTTKV